VVPDALRLKRGAAIEGRAPIEIIH
jgi:hypothetical protein